MRTRKRLQTEIIKTKNIHSLFQLLVCNRFHFNWMGVEYLQTMAVASGNKELEDVLKCYTDDILSKTLGEIWNFIPSFHNIKMKFYSKVRARFHGINPDGIVVKDLKKYQPKLAEDISLHIMKIGPGSLTITWCISAELTYQAYLLALSIPQKLKKDDFLQIGQWVVLQPQFVLQKLQKAYG